MPSAHYFSPEPGSDPTPRQITVSIAGEPLTITTAGGVFSPGRLDTGTAVLLDSVPPPPQSGDVLDLGAGWGPISYALARSAPDATIWSVDVNERALELITLNAAQHGFSGINATTPSGVPEAVRFDAIWSNPPIRVGKQELHGMLRHWLPRLKPGCDAWLVVQKNLGSDSLLSWLSTEFDGTHVSSRATTKKGYRVLRVHRTTTG
ncbi:class I SAM-dependent methyltransferase [Mycetocola reblochoni]|uniref:Class I SAM-dependent methyltransferase n=2 Tax=Mycetocola reblochoni TaxID=331618 RepID=A0A3L6ZJU1_9MICO|nr:methyltransferase [Mycetocola reblochoni]RLP68123.1 class I SAM-dependent methyltransferase [Mycetocola reblochoni]SJN18172.1 putative methyltransferase small domain protein [Mycetocola reblochoni REB411]